MPAERSGAACPDGAVTARWLGVDRQDFWNGPSGPHRSVSEVSCKGTEAVEVPAERSGAACPDGAVTARWLGVDRRDFRRKSP